VLPYQRPPLSKSFLKNPEEALQLHRGRPWYDDGTIHVHLGDRAVAIDRARRKLRLQSGKELEYEHLVLATGTRARRLPHIPEGLTNVAVLRTAADALLMRDLLAKVNDLVVVGGGFIGLEIASTARALGKPVCILESAPRLLMRSVSPEIGAHVLQTHIDSGIEIRLGAAVGGFRTAADRLAALSVDGEEHLVDTLVLGIGAVPEHALASDAGLECENGVIVNEHMQTSDPAILAIGDCTLFPEPTTGRRLRLESVQNANDQAKAAVATLTGNPQRYQAVPWFWSEQGSMRLQMAGLMPDGATRHRRPGSSPANFSILHYVGDQLRCVESVNAPVDHMAARKLLEAGRTVTPQAACDPAIPLKQHILS
jgi:3-phenylpropionate/trans-cinnamate dioxygenase ferredoxin reductase subunit